MIHLRLCWTPFTARYSCLYEFIFLLSSSSPSMALRLRFTTSDTIYGFIISLLQRLSSIDGLFPGHNWVQMEWDGLLRIEANDLIVLKLPSALVEVRLRLTLYDIYENCLLRVESFLNCYSFLALDVWLCLLLESEERLSLRSLSKGNSLTLFLKEDLEGKEFYS